MNLSLPIIKTLAFFKIYNQPLTLVELKERLFVEQKTDWEDLEKSLQEFLDKGVVVEDRGFFFLTGSEQAVDQRIERIFWENSKMVIAQHAAKVLAGIPFIKLVAVCNTLSFGVSKPESDIDFFVVAKSGRLWLVRALAVFRLFMAGFYRRGSRVADKICLSFFIDDTKENLQELLLPSANQPDIYFIYWLTQLVPLINREQELDKVWQANSWLTSYLANWDFAHKAQDYRLLAPNRFKEGWRQAGEYLWGGWGGDWVERFCKKIQLLKMRSSKHSHGPKSNSSVVISDHILKFHEDDRRELFRKKWHDNFSQLTNKFPHV